MYKLFDSRKIPLTKESYGNFFCFNLKYRSLHQGTIHSDLGQIYHDDLCSSPDPEFLQSPERQTLSPGAISANRFPS